jgi:hypothetical protein
MGRFDALTQIAEQHEKKPPVPEVPSPTPKITQVHGGKKENHTDEKPAKLQTRLPASPQARKPANLPFPSTPQEKPEKYTTRLLPSLIKRVRLHAIEKDIKDYELVTTALIQYFERNT